MSMASAAGRVRKSTGAFSPLVVIGMIVISVFAFSAFVTLSTFAGDFRDGDDGGAHALSKSAVGYAGIVALEQARGRMTLIGRGEKVSPKAFGIVTPVAQLTIEKIQALGPSRRLIVLPKWAATPDVLHPGWVRAEGAVPPDFIASLLTKIAPKATIAQRPDRARVALTVEWAPEDVPDDLTTGPIDHLQTLAGPGLEPVIVDERGAIIVAMLEDEETFILSDPDFLNTHGLADIDTARAGVAILDGLSAPNETLAFDVSLNGFARSRSVMKLALEPPFLGATLAAFAAALLLGWRAAIRFGAPARTGRAIALGKQALADNSAGLIRLAKREPQMAWPYAVLTRTIVMKAIGARGETSEEETTALLDRVGETQGAGARYSELAAEAAAVKTPHALIEVARKLYQWKTEMTRAAS